MRLFNRRRPTNLRIVHGRTSVAWPHDQRRLRIWRDPRSYLTAALVIVMVLLILVPTLVDATLTLARPVHESNGTCRILRVKDGDTVTMWCKLRGVTAVRLTGFDTPELFSPRCPSELVRAVLSKWQLRLFLLTASNIEARHLGTERYGRDMKALFVDGTTLASRMIDAGLARRYDGGKRSDWCQIGFAPGIVWKDPPQP